MDDKVYGPIKVETDPTGIGQHSPGAKLDDGNFEINFKSLTNIFIYAMLVY